MAALAGSGTSDENFGGSGVGYAIQWGGGGKRKLLEGNAPKYPAGVNQRAQIKLKVVVLPNGIVKSAQPIQKANTKLENAALKEVRLWKFEALPTAQKQKEQTCQITFNFDLK